MKTPTILALAGVLLNLSAGSAAAAKLEVVATLPDFAALASIVGDDHVKCTSLARGTEDAHFVDPRPSFIRILNRADLLIHGGAELEIGWLPPLIRNARNARILAGRSGDVPMSEGIPLLEVPTGAVDRAQGDVHALGNPHYWLDPANSPIMARHLAQVFGRLDAEHAEAYADNADAYAARIQTKLTEWESALKPLRGTPILTYHKTYEYLAKRFGLKIVGYLAFSPQRVLVQTVEISEPITGPTPTPSLRKELLGF